MLNGAHIATDSRLGRTLRAPLRLLPSSWHVPILQGPGRGMRWRIGSSDHGCWLGWYEADVIREIVPHLTRPGIAYDLGANAGYYALVLSRYMRHVFAFEPCAENLRHHVRINRLQDKITIVAAAVAETSGEGFFERAASPSQRHIGSVGDPVKLVALDGLDIPDPCFVKI